MTQPFPFDTYRSSDEDGSPHLVVDGTKFDLTGWTTELADKKNGTVDVQPFESREATRLGDGTVTVNPYMFGDWVPCWMVNVEGQRVLAFIDPDGVRYGAYEPPPTTAPRAGWTQRILRLGRRQ